VSLPSRRRIGLAAVATTVALVASGTAGLAPAVAAPVDPPADADPGPAAAAAGWLADELGDDGLLTHDSGYGPFTDVGLSLDAGFALSAVGGHTADIQRILGGLAAELPTYVGEGTERYAGALAKAAVFVRETGSDPATFDDEIDLVARLEERVLTDAPVAGRIADESTWGDFANSIGQAFAARALSAEGSPLADEVTAFLLDQQCAAGFFRLDFTKDKTTAAQSCDEAPSTGTPSADTTALVLQQLAAIDEPDADVTAALTRGAAWLKSQQRGGGAFTDGGAINANTTGLAGWTLGLLGEDAAAARAAHVLRSLQAATLAPCLGGLEGDEGAVALDPGTLAAARTPGIDPLTRAQWARATAQAVPALAWARRGPGTATVKAPVWARAGKKVRIRAAGFAPGETVCVQVGAREVVTTAGAKGAVGVRVPVQKKPARRIVRVVGDSGVATPVVRVKALKKKKLRVQVAKRPLRAGAVQRIVVRGLAAGEPVKVFVRGKRVAAGRAGKKGAFQKRVRIAKAGPARVRAVGKFPKLRRGAAQFRVVR